MKTLKNYIIMTGISLSLIACEDFALGDKFLQKPPSADITIDTIFSNAEYARRVLWNSYDNLPFGLPITGRRTVMNKGTIEGLTDLANTFVNDSGERQVYYPGKYNADIENGSISTERVTKYRFSEFGAWTGIRHAWLFCENADRVPDMNETEKKRLKAEAKILVAIFYSDMFRHYGGLPLLDHAMDIDEANLPVRATVEETVNFIVKLLDEAIACEELPWTLPEDDRTNWNGRLTKASAMGLKARVLLFAASPLFNSSEPFLQGEAADKRLTWWGDYQESRWQDAANAAEDFFKKIDENGYYRLVQREDTEEGTYRQAFQDAYYERGTTEILISSHRNYYLMTAEPLFMQSFRWGGFCPTKEYFDMFPMADGTDFDWNNPTHSKNPFINRDPRLAETILMDGESYGSEKVETFIEDPNDPTNYPKGKHIGNAPFDASSMPNGFAMFKFALNRGAMYNNHKCQWPILRLAEIYLSYAEALNELGRTNTPDSRGMTAYDYINAVRARVGLPELTPGLNKEQFREAVLRERACEFGWEEVRFFDLIRWKREDIFSKHLHGLKIYRNRTTKEYRFEEYQLEERAWQKPGGFTPAYYLSAFPSDEVNKGYGLVQNPGWE